MKKEDNVRMEMMKIIIIRRTTATMTKKETKR